MRISAVGATLVGHVASGLAKVLVISGSIWALGPDKAGLFAGHFNLGLSIAMFSSVGFAGVAVHFGPRITAIGGEPTRFVRRLIPLLVWASLLGSGIAFALTPGVSDERAVVALLVVCHALYVFAKHLPFVSGRVFRYAVLEITVIALVGVGLVWTSSHENSHYLLLTISVAFAVAAAIGFAELGVNRSNQRDAHSGFPGRQLRHYGYFVVLATAGAYAANQMVVPVMVWRGAASSDVAYLAGVVALASPILLLPRALGMNLVPMISAQTEAGSVAYRSVVLRMVAMLSLGAFLIAIPMVIILGPFVVESTLKTGRIDVFEALAVAITSALVVAVASPLSNLFAGTGRVHLNAMASVVHVLAVGVAMSAVGLAPKAVAGALLLASVARNITVAFLARGANRVVGLRVMTASVGLFACVLPIGWFGWEKRYMTCLIAFAMGTGAAVVSAKAWRDGWFSE